MRSKRAEWLLVGSLAVVLLGFLAESAFMFHADRLVDEQAARTQASATGRLQHIQAIRKGMVELGVCAPAPSHTRAAIVGCSVAARDRIVAALDRYERLGDFPEQPERMSEVRRELARLDAGLAAMRAALGGAPDFDAAMASVLAELEPLDGALDRLSRAAMQHTLKSASEVEALLWRSELAELALSGTAFLIAALATLLAVRAIRRHNRALAAKADELEQFAATVAHDLLSPLASLGIAMPVIQHRHADDEQTQRMTARALSSVKRVRALVDGLLDFARAGGRPTGARAEVASVIGDVVSELAEQAAAANATVAVEGVEGCAVACSPSALYSIVSNLVANALKYLGDASERLVRIRVVDRGARVRIEVEDTGPGVPPSLAQTIFTAYVRGPASGKPGLGLGLATVKRLVLAHGGEVGMCAPERGGACFWLELPRAPVAAVAPRVNA